MPAIAWEVYHAHASTSWPSTNGVITENAETVTRHRERWPRRRSGSRTINSVQRHVRYTYTVDGAAYLGSRVAYHGYEQCECEGLDRPNGEVRVYYDPGEPSRAVLLPGIRCSVLPTVAILAFGLFVGSTLGYFGATAFEWIGLRARR